MKTDKFYNLALRYLARRARSVKEMEQYLEKKAACPNDIADIIARLLDLKYLNDQEFARQFIDNRIRFKPKSTYALGFELRQKGVSPEIADPLLSSLDNFALAVAAVELKAAMWHHLDKENQRKKLMNHLRYRGFDYGTCQAMWERFSQEQ